MSDNEATIELVVDSIRRPLQRDRRRIVMLQQKDGDRVLPIWIGGATARAIIAAFMCREYPNLSLTCLTGYFWPLLWLLNARRRSPLDFQTRRRLLAGDGIRHFVITGLQERAFVARIEFDAGAWSPDPLPIRPSDALVLAARQQRPLYVSRPVLAKAGITRDEAEEE